MGGRRKPLDVQREDKPGKYADGDGLYLIVAGPTSKNWSYRYWFSGRERWYGLGSLKDLGLADARLARDAARLRVKGDRNTSGVDIVLEIERPARIRRRPRSSSGRRPLNNARKPTLTKIGTAGATSTAFNGPPH